MKYCTRCGNELLDEAVVCTKCGCYAEASSYHNVFKYQPQKDEAEAGLIVISALIPLVGFILWAVKNSETPSAAQKYGQTAIISVGVQAALGVLIVLSFAGLVGGLISSI